MRVRLDAGVRRIDGGRVLLGGAPFRLTRLSDQGVAALDRILSVDAGLDGPAIALRTRLLDAGVLVPDGPDSRGQLPEVDLTVVVPVRDSPDDLRQCLVSVREACPLATVIVVDDGSHDHHVHASVADAFGATVRRRDTAGGPAAARNAGVLDVGTTFVLLVDADVQLADDAATTLSSIVGYFDDPEVAMVAPRVVAKGGSGSRGTYERARFPIDMGPSSSRIAPMARVTYAPAAVLVCRRAALEAVGGFDEGLRFGEDVDLVWRLVEAGWRCWYDERIVASHPVRGDVGAWLRQRADYGSSAAELSVRHGAVVAPWRGSRWSLVLAALLAAGHPVAGAGVVAGNAVALWRKLGGRGVGPVEAARLVARGHIVSLLALARASVRPWWPIGVAVVPNVGRRARRRLLIAAVAPGLWGWWRSERRLDPMRWTAWWLLDDAAYGAGVWRGVVSAIRHGRGHGRSPLGAVAPVVVEWPGRAPGSAPGSAPGIEN